MLTGAGRTIAWTSFNIPSQITSCPPDATGAACKTTRFVYNSEHERTTEYLADGSTVHVLSPRYDTGLHFEKRLKVDGSIEYEHYLYAGGLMFGKYVTHTNALGAPIQSTDMAGTQRSRVIEYYLKDHLGSITAQVNGDANPPANPEAGKYAVRYLSYDVWGKKRYSDGVPDTAGALNNPDMYHGYTGHEMLDEVGLIHMNGRLYDPVLGRFVSADPNIPNPGNLQSYNRYTYCLNNPVTCTDPSGYFDLGDLFKVAVVAAVSFYAPQMTAYFYGAMTGTTLAAATAAGTVSMGSLMTAGALSGAVVGGVSGFAMSGGDLNAVAQGAMVGAVGGALFTGASQLGGVGEAGANSLERYLGHAGAGCVSAMAGGGKCGPGATAAFAGKWMTNHTGSLGNKFDQFAAATIAGGTVSVIGGGKFSNGAVTSAMGYLYNAALTVGASARLPGWAVKLLGIDGSGVGAGGAVSFPAGDGAEYDFGAYGQVAGGGEDYGTGRYTTDFGIQKGSVRDMSGSGAEVGFRSSPKVAVNSIQ